MDISGVADSLHIDADPNADPDPASHKSDVNLLLLVCNIPRLHFERPRAIRIFLST
jgi:hypothetical protein